MTIQDSVGVYDSAEFADNPEARCSIVLILDVSGSMGWPAPFNTVQPGPGQVPRHHPSEDSRHRPAGRRGRHRVRPRGPGGRGLHQRHRLRAPSLSTNWRHQLLQGRQPGPGHHRGPQAELPRRRHRLLPQPGLLPHRRLCRNTTTAGDLANWRRPAWPELEENRSIAFFCFRHRHGRTSRRI